MICFSRRSCHHLQSVSFTCWLSLQCVDSVLVGGIWPLPILAMYPQMTFLSWAISTLVTFVKFHMLTLSPACVDSVPVGRIWPLPIVPVGQQPSGPAILTLKGVRYHLSTDIQGSMNTKSRPFFGQAVGLIGSVVPMGNLANDQSLSSLWSNPMDQQFWVSRESNIILMKSFLPYIYEDGGLHSSIGKHNFSFPK